MHSVPLKIFRRVEAHRNGPDTDVFSISIPWDWHVIEIEKSILEVGRFQTLMLVRPANNLQIEVELSAVLHPTSTSLFSWATSFLESVGYTVISARQTGYPEPQLIDVDANCEREGVKYFAKTLARFHKDLGVLLQARCELDLYGVLSEDLTYILLSLNIKESGMATYVPSI